MPFFNDPQKLMAIIMECNKVLVSSCDDSSWDHPESPRVFKRADMFQGMFSAPKDGEEV